MIFYSSLFYLIIFLHEIFGLLEIRFNIKNECSVKLETDNGVETCFNQKCSDYKDPWRILNTHIQDKPCYLHYLKLSFTNYDQLLVFIELQTANNHSLGHFFNDQDANLCMLEIEIDTIYPFNKKYFLTENMLNKLGGKTGNIDILQIEIKRWYQSPRSIVQLIENNIVEKQPFKQITIYYQCNINQTMERLILAKYLKYQERSTCPTQINIIPHEDLSTSGNQTINQSRINRSMNIHFNDKIYYINKSYLIFNKSHFYYNKKKESPQWNLFAKIGIVLILIALIIAFVVYHCIYSRSQSPNNNSNH